MKATTTYIFVMMCFSVGDGLSFMGKTIIIIVFRWLHAASTHSFAGSSQIKYVLRSPVCRCSVSCANIYSISSHPTWHMCASSLAMRCHATIVQSNLRLWKFTAFSYVLPVHIFLAFQLRFDDGIFTFRQCKFAEIYSGNHALLCAECLSLIPDTHFSSSVAACVSSQ